MTTKNFLGDMSEPIQLTELPKEILDLPVREVEVKCGVFMNEDGSETTMVGGCGKIMLMVESYRCTDCTVHFHRDCAREHFKFPVQPDARVV